MQAGCGDEVRDNIISSGNKMTPQQTRSNASYRRQKSTSVVQLKSYVCLVDVKDGGMTTKKTA